MDTDTEIATVCARDGNGGDRKAERYHRHDHSEDRRVETNRGGNRFSEPLSETFAVAIFPLFYFWILTVRERGYIR